MNCVKLIKGFDDRCSFKNLRVLQKAVLINYDDVVFQAKNNTNTLHNVLFALFSPNARPPRNISGFGFHAPEISDIISGSFDMSRKLATPVYTHHIDILINGVNENIKTLHKQLDGGNFLGALKYSDGTIVIFGSETGLSVDPYSYETSGVITLTSDVEFTPPYVYSGDSVDFDNNWGTDWQIIRAKGEYNDDYNDDYKRHF